MVVTTVELDYLLGLCIIWTPIFFILLSSLTASSMLNIKKTHSQTLGLRGILVRQEKLDWLFAL